MYWQKTLKIHYHKDKYIIIKGPEHIFIKHWNEVNLLYAKIKFILNTSDTQIDSS